MSQKKKKDKGENHPSTEDWVAARFDPLQYLEMQGDVGI